MIIYVVKSETRQELNTVNHICELERTHLLNILAMSVQNLQLGGYLSTGNRSNFLYVERCSVWLYDFPQFSSSLWEADKDSDRISKYNQDTVVLFGPITRQTINYALPIFCDNNPQMNIALEPVNDENFTIS